MRDLLLGVWLLWAGVLACGDSPFTEGAEIDCQGETCLCTGSDEEPRCEAECPEGGCDTACSDAEDCALECGNGCTHQCTDLNNCVTECGDDCQLACDRLSSCKTECGQDCVQSCEDVGNCAFTVGDGSRVQCTRVGNCNVTCRGSCTVVCEGAGNCNVGCAPGAGDATLCPDGKTRACGQPCPPTAG
ncbi:MAG TPA: hypothetical protein VEY30_10510 [Myxococcaceae bacterium]|nr:hypothetical protein [Myxococcaceae bacterium]